MRNDTFWKKLWIKQNVAGKGGERVEGIQGGTLMLFPIRSTSYSIQIRVPIIAESKSKILFNKSKQGLFSIWYFD